MKPVKATQSYYSKGINQWTAGKTVEDYNSLEASLSLSEGDVSLFEDDMWLSWRQASRDPTITPSPNSG